MNKVQKLLETECSPFVNPMAATSVMIEKKIERTKDIIKKWEDSEKAAIIAEKNDPQNNATQPNQNNSSSGKKKKNKLKEYLDDPTRFIPRSAIDVLTMAGIKASDLSKINKVMSEAKKISDIAKNYGKESNADFLTKVANVQTFLSHKGLTGVAGCNILNSVFNISMGLGKALLGSVNSALSTVTDMVSKIGGWIETGLAFGAEIADRIMKTFNDITSMIDNALQSIVELANQLKQAIQDEINAFKEMLIYNARMALGGLLGGLLDDPCVKGLVNNIGSSAMKGLF